MKLFLQGLAMAVLATCMFALGAAAFILVMLSQSPAADLTMQYREHAYEPPAPMYQPILPAPVIVEIPTEPRCTVERTVDHDDILGDDWTERSICQ